jgi:TonB family protein
VKNKRADIAQIRKYLSGELDARSMHQLEREAQNDPFLMDALEGYESSAPDQQANLDELNARLAKRIKADDRKVILLRPLAIAASVLIIAALAILFWRISRTSTVVVKAPVAIRKPESNITSKDSIRQLHGQPPSRQQPATKDGYANVPVTSYTKHVLKGTGRTDTIVKQYATVVTSMQASAPSALLYKKGPSKASASASDSTNNLYAKTVQLQGRVAGVEVTTPEGLRGRVTDLNDSPLVGVQIRVSGTNLLAQTNSNGQFMLPATARNKTLSVGYLGFEAQDLQTSADSVHIRLKPSMNALAETRVIGYGTQKQLNEVTVSKPPSAIKGVVKDEEGHPLPGVSVKVKGTTAATITDVNGHFRLPVKTDKATLDIAFVGFKTSELNANTRDSVRVNLKEMGQSLSEVVVTRSEPNDTYQQTIAAHPQQGWHSFNKYIKESAISPDGKKGKVRVSFTVYPNGSLGDFKVVRSLSAAADTKAIELIRNGGSWFGDTDGTPHKITIKVIFK